MKARDLAQQLDACAPDADVKVGTKDVARLTTLPDGSISLELDFYPDSNETEETP